MIELDKLSFSYGDTRIVKDLSFIFNQGETYTIIGKSGCGKTTLLYLLDGLILPKEGTILINNKPIKKVRKETSLILQNYGLFPWLTLQANLRIGLKIDTDTVLETARKLHIENELNQYPATLSGGQKQRGAIARALLRKADLLLIDEMSAALDSLTQKAIQDEVLRIQKEQNLTMIMVTHNIEEAVRMGQTIIIMHEGKFTQVLSNPYFNKVDYTEDYDFYKLCQKVRGYLNEE